MPTLRNLSKPISFMVIGSLLALTLRMPAANAALVPTEALVSAAQGVSARAQIKDTLARAEVRQALAEHGVDPAHVQARVEALTDSEAATLASQLDELPAGGDGLGLLVFVFLVLLITDILGLTDIFPFVKKPHRR